jgi:putative intracellular protease/amidase
MATKKRRVLIVLSECEFRGAELIGPHETFAHAGYDVDLTTPKGKRPVADGHYVGTVGKETSVIVDYPFVTGRSTPDSCLTGQKMVEARDNGLQRYGW